MGRQPGPSRRESDLRSVRWYGPLACVCSVLLSATAQAVPAHYGVSQLFHTQWTAQTGAPTGVAYIAQTSDGFLWLATSGGLFRFDGVEFERFTGTEHVPLLSQNIFTLHATSDGDLWIGHYFGGISLLRHGRLTNYGRDQGLPGGTVEAFARTLDGTVWAGTTRGLYRLEGGQWHLASAAWSTPTHYVDALLVDRDQVLWMQSGKAVLYLRPHAKEFEALPDLGIANGESSLIADADGGAALCTHEPFGVLKLKVPSASSPYIPDWNHRYGQVDPNDACTFDKEGHLWDGGVEGAGRFLLSSETSAPALDELLRFKADLAPLTGKFVTQVLEDREGNIWFSTLGGIDRFRTPALSRVALPPHASGIFMVRTAGDHGMWVSSTYGDVERFDGTARQHIKFDELKVARIDAIYSTRAGALWAGGADSIWQLQPNLSWRRSARLRTRQTGPASSAYGNIGAMTQDAQGAMWVSVLRVGTYRVIGDQWTLWGGRTDMPTDNANALLTDTQDRIWFGYNDGSIAVLDGDRLTMIADGRHLPGQMNIGPVRVFAQEHDRMWIGSTQGLWRVDGKVIRPVVGEHGAFSDVTGIVRRSNGDLWLSTVEGVVHITSGELQRSLENPDSRVRYQLLTYLDGLPGIPVGAAANDDSIWIATDNGVIVADPSHPPRNAVAPTTIVKSMTADGVVHSMGEGSAIRLPAHTHNLQISYTAPSLTMPERVTFRYRLAPADATWQDVGNRRAAYFTDLAPGQYHFQVIAANNDGLWGTPSASVDFVVPPTFMQTPWFTALCVSAAAGALWFIYLLRLRSVKARLRLRLEERLVERERIARDLHDTLLQGLASASLQLEVADRQIPTDASAKPLVQRVTQSLRQLVEESRQAVRHIRLQGSEEEDLEQALTQISNDLAAHRRVKHHLVVEGSRRPLRPLVREEIYRIAGEALANAFRHSGASTVETVLEYGRDYVRLLVRDDGQGIDPEVLNAGREGHFGLSGLRERALRIGAVLNVRTGAGAGTEIDLLVPAAAAFERPAPGGLAHWVAKLYRRGARP
jgi:signal transduction histidine kinase/ligand-binding sensor domain-containing protein